VAARGAHEVTQSSRERPRDDAADAMRPNEQFPGDLAHAVELADRNNVIVGGNLKHAVARRVNDELTRANVFFTKFLYDFRAGGGLVSDGFPADLPLKFLINSGGNPFL